MASLADVRFESRLMPLLLKRRGWTDAWMSEHKLTREHGTLAHIDEMCAELKVLHDAGSRIVILPDSDCDGVMAGVLGWAGLSALGFRCGLYETHPETGYEMTCEDIDRACEQFPDAQAFITCDVGITCHEAALYARSLSKVFLVTDHHEPDDVPIEARCVVDPSADKSAYGWDGICGAYVFLQVIERYARLYEPQLLPQLAKLHVFAGIATVSDVMPLWKENRALVKMSIDDSNRLRLTNPAALNDGTAIGAARAGLSILYRELNSQGKLYPPVTEKTYGWTIAPIINSVKRLGEPMSLVQRIFLSNDLAEKQEDARKIIALNAQRQKVTNDCFEKAQNSPQPFAPCLWQVDMPHGFAGLVANKVMGSTNLPALVIHRDPDGSWSGSGRSPAWFDFLSWMRAYGLGDANGHEQAFGYGLSGKENPDFAALAKALAQDARMAQAAAPEKMTYDFTIGDGGDVNPADSTELTAFVHDCRFFEPWGSQWPKPVALLELPPSATWQPLSRNPQTNRHSKCRLAPDVSAILWNVLPQKAQEIRQLRVQIELNRWSRGGRVQQDVQLMPADDE